MTRKPPARTALTIVRKYFPRVKTVRDATEPVIIDVTPEDCSAAKKLRHSRCVLAVAGKRMMHLDGAVMAINTAYLVKGKAAVRYLVGQAAQREITSFDRSGIFAAGLYKLRKPDKGHLLGSPGGHKSKTGRTRRRPHHTTQNIRAVVG